jgi:sirohydrochlorin cobaltochelatase
MGHGTEHYSNASYSMLEDMFQYKGYKNVYVATVEGFPEIDFAITKMKNAGIKKVTLMPFMIVAGDHAKNDMAGDEEDSWKNILLSEGFEVSTILKGLGENLKICDMLYRHSLKSEGRK